MFKILSDHDFKVIRDDEMEIWSQLVTDRDYLNVQVEVREENMFHSLVHGMDNLISYNVMKAYERTYNVDEDMMKDAVNLAYFEDGYYRGTAWLYLLNGQSLGVYGIRSSLAGVLLGKKGFTQMMISCIENMGYQRVIFPNPLDSMKRLLFERGYEEKCISDGTIYAIKSIY